MQIQNDQSPKAGPKFLLQIGFPGKVILITSTKGKSLQPMAKGVAHGVHWTAYKIGYNQAYGEVLVEDSQIRIIKVLPEEERLIWQVSVGKDGRRPPDGWQQAVDAAINMAMCSKENCLGHWPPSSPSTPSTLSKLSTSSEQEKPQKTDEAVIRPKPSQVVKPLIIRRKPKFQAKLRPESQIITQRPITPQKVEVAARKAEVKTEAQTSQKQEGDITTPKLPAADKITGTTVEVFSGEKPAEKSPVSPPVIEKLAPDSTEKRTVRKRGRPKKTDR